MYATFYVWFLLHYYHYRLWPSVLTPFPHFILHGKCKIRHTLSDASWPCKARTGTATWKWAPKHLAHNKQVWWGRWLRTPALVYREYVFILPAYILYCQPRDQPKISFMHVFFFFHLMFVRWQPLLFFATASYNTHFIFINYIIFFSAYSLTVGQPNHLRSSSTPVNQK